MLTPLKKNSYEFRRAVIPNVYFLRRFPSPNFHPGVGDFFLREREREKKILQGTLPRQYISILAFHYPTHAFCVLG